MWQCLKFNFNILYLYLISDIYLIFISLFDIYPWFLDKLEVGWKVGYSDQSLLLLTIFCLIDCLSSVQLSVFFQADFDQFYSVCRPTKCPNLEACGNQQNFTNMSSQGWFSLLIIWVTIKKLFNLLTMKCQWTYGPTQLPWFDYFHTSLACFTAL